MYDLVGRGSAVGGASDGQHRLLNLNLRATVSNCVRYLFNCISAYLVIYIMMDICVQLVIEQ